MAKRPTTRSKATDPAAPAAESKPKRTRAATATAAEQAPVGPTEVSDEDIRRRAYERYQQRGGNHGRHFDDWVEAEKELRNKK